MNSKLTVTDRAVHAMRKQLEKRLPKTDCIRFGIRGGGCTGYSYVFEFEDNIRDSDIIIEHDGIRVVVDPKSMALLEGTTIDFETGIRGHGFKFDNPNVASNCGCGESISFSK